MSKTMEVPDYNELTEELGLEMLLAMRPGESAHATRVSEVGYPAENWHDTSDGAL